MTKLTPEQIEQNVIAYRAWLNDQTIELESSLNGELWSKFGSTPFWDWHRYNLMVRVKVKPTPKLRPWKPEEIPVGAVVRYRKTTYRHIIDSTWQGFAHFNACNYDAIVLFEDYEWHWPHETEWLPCGVMEDVS